jgi:hypothetical protein
LAKDNKVVGAGTIKHLPPIVTEKEFEDVNTLNEEKIKKSFSSFVKSLHLFLNHLPCVYDIQKIRNKWIKNRRDQKAFGTFATDPKHWYTFNRGGRNEAQFNIGLYITHLRVGFGFEFTLKKGGDPSIVQLSYACFVNVIKNELERFQKFVSNNLSEIEWFAKNGNNLEFIPTENVVSWLIEPTKEPAWLFIGRLLRRGKGKEILKNPIKLGQTIDNVFKGIKPIWEQMQMLARRHR